MPTYLYRCKSCGHEMSVEQKMADDPLVKCPSCKKRSLVRVIGSAGLVFKGSGFYLTDYKSRGSEGATATTASEGSGAAAREKTQTSGTPAGDSAGATGPAESGKGAEKPAKSEKGGSDKGGSEKGGSEKGGSGKGDKGGSKRKGN